MCAGSCVRRLCLDFLSVAISVRINPLQHAAALMESLNKANSVEVEMQ